MDRAYSLLDIKSVNEAERVIQGIASTPTPDRMGDIVEPMGAKFALPMPLLWQQPTKAGIPFTARLVHPDTVESATLKDRLQLAWDSIKTNLVKAVSIGFRAIEYSRLETGGLRFLEWEWLELSAVTIPAQADATINTIKSIDRELLAVRDGGAPVEVEPEVEAEPEDGAASGPSVHVVKLNTPARARAPFVINKINHLG